MNAFFHSNKWQYRLLRTIVQGMLGVIMAWISDGQLDWKCLLVALVPVVLSPIMAEMGSNEQVKECDDE